MNRNTEKLNKRQDLILSFIEEKSAVSVGQIMEQVTKELGQVTRMTISRDLEKMLELKLIQRQGESRRTAVYQLSSQYAMLKKIDVEKYFAVEPDQRKIRGKFNFEIFSQLKNIFTEDEKKKLSELNEIYRDKIKDIAPDALRKEIERLNIDFSWKSSKIEGNTYSLLETEQLIKNQQEATGHTKEEATMILNHKKATLLFYEQNNISYFKELFLGQFESAVENYFG